MKNKFVYWQVVAVIDTTKPGYCMSITAKITSITDPNRITIGEDVYNSLHPVLKTRFRGLNNRIEDWKYTNNQTEQLYKLYVMEY